MNRWRELQAAVKLSDLPAADRHVFLSRLDHSAYGTAEMAAQWTRTQKKVARETGLSLRQVQYSEAHLERHGWLKVTGTTGPGKSRRYEFAAGRQCDCTGRVHTSQRTQPAPATDATGASERTQPTDATPQVNGRISGQDIDKEKGDESALTVTCPFCPATVTAGHGPIRHEPYCWRGGMNALYEAERGA